jgi:hypothetical protein
MRAVESAVRESRLDEFLATLANGGGHAAKTPKKSAPKKAAAPKKKPAAKPKARR